MCGAPSRRHRAENVAQDVVLLRLAVAHVLEGWRDRLVGDLEVAAAGQLLELHQREVRLDAGRVAVHQQADRAGRREQRRLGVAVAVLVAEQQRAVPGVAGGLAAGCPGRTPG